MLADAVAFMSSEEGGNASLPEVPPPETLAASCVYLWVRVCVFHPLPQKEKAAVKQQ